METWGVECDGIAATGATVPTMANAKVAAPFSKMTSVYRHKSNKRGFRKSFLAWSAATRRQQGVEERVLPGQGDGRWLFGTA